MNDAGINGPIQMEVVWTPALLNEVYWLNMTAFGSRDRKRHQRTTALMWVVIAGLLLFLFIPMQDLFPRSLLSFALGMMVMRAIVTYLHIPAMNRRRIAHVMSSPLASSPPFVKLADKGVTIDQATSFTAYDWVAISDVQEEPLASHLIVGKALSIPIPDAALPHGVTREKLLRRIEAWRENAK